jgi:hypothetical protein
MTIKVTIKNEDYRENAVIKVVSIDPKTGFRIAGVERQLTAGESEEFYVYIGQSLEVGEVSQ